MDSLPLLGPQRFIKNIYLWSAFITQRMLNIWYFQSTLQGTFLWVSSIISGVKWHFIVEEGKNFFWVMEIWLRTEVGMAVSGRNVWSSTTVVLSHYLEASWEKYVTVKHYEGCREIAAGTIALLGWVRNLSGNFRGYFSPPLVPFGSFPCTFMWRFLHGLHESCFLRGNLEEGS